MAYVTVDVDIDNFDDDELIEELECRGYQVIDNSGELESSHLNEYEIDAILRVFKDSALGTIGHEIYEKLRKR